MDGPTVFPPLNAVLRELVVSVRTILAENFVGAYLQGSFAVGDADEHSDVDFVVVTAHEVSDAQLVELQTMHKRIYALEIPWAQHLEGSYVPKDALQHVDPARSPYLYLDNGASELEWDDHDNTAVVRWSLRECGVVLAGPDPRSLVDPVSAERLREEALRAMDEWARWAATIESWSARVQPLLVLSYCRMLHTLETGTITSKRKAGEWALGALDDEWADLIRRALGDRSDPWAKVRRPADPEAMERTSAFMSHAKESAGRRHAR